MRLLRIVLLLSFIWLLSCKEHKSKMSVQLESVEKALSIDADSARNLFNSIDTTSLNNERDLMMYDYLNNQILMETEDINPEDGEFKRFNDSIIIRLNDYSRKYDDDYLKARASYLKGISYYFKKDMKHALECEFDALNFLEGVDDPYLEGNIHYIIATIYHSTFKPGPGLKNARRAIQCFDRIGNLNRVLGSRVMLMSLLHSSNEHDSVIQIAPDLAEEAKLYSDKSMRFGALSALANSYVHKEQYDKAIEVFNELDNENLLTPYYEGEYIYALVLNGDIDIAKERMKKTEELPPFAQLVKAREVFFLAVGDTINAYRQAAVLNNWQSDVMASTFNDGIIDSVEESYQKDRDLKAEKIRYANIIKWTVIISSLIILLVLTASGTWFYHRKIKLKNMQLDLHMEEIRHLSDSVHEYRKQVDDYKLQVDDYRLQKEQLSEDISGLFKQQWNTLNLLCNEYFEKGDNPALKATILKEVEKEIKRISGRDGLKNIEEALNRHFDDIIKKLRDQLPDFDKKDIAFLTFSYAGFSPRAICLFTGFTIKYYYKKRAVLKDKIMATDAPDRQLFVDLLG